MIERVCQTEIRELKEENKRLKLENEQLKKGKGDVKKQQKQIFNHYGLDLQLDQLVEECSEVIQAACKYKRRCRDLNNPRILGSLIEEIADVKNLIEQLELSDVYIARRVEELKESKVKRQIKRIEKEKEIVIQ
ncbi:hypothetical protein [Senegalia massiliensis]|uniref:hypothetical protein n=1 Tax=Senegalia massiliensis TaxID=1720316 RepID=UPI001030E8FE|nr:hypothetical protein [Senegalia massiliensis]